MNNPKTLLMTLLVGRQEGHLTCKKLSCVMLVCLCVGQGADLHMAQLMPLPLTISCSSKSRLVLPSWFYLSYIHCESEKNWATFIFTVTLANVGRFFTRDSIYAIASICHGNSVCLSVCLSVRLSHGWISQKRLQLGSRNFHRTVAPSS